MVFSGIVFLYAFMPLALIAYFAVPQKFKNYILILFSLVFYFYGERAYTLLLLFCTFCNYLFSLFIQNNFGTTKAKYALWGALIISLGILFFYKYADFLIITLNKILGTSVKRLNLRLPVGISFFTFQALSYTIDVYRGNCKAQKAFSTVLCYISLFPQLVAGPIVRYVDIESQMNSRKIYIEKISSGILRFTIGLGKKILLANVLGEIVSAYKMSTENSLLFVWLYALSYVLQVYFDFSAYSDMAIGLGRIFGFEFTENFNYPYISKSITEFWRRWHISLGSWFRDYVYIPLGGNRVSKAKWVRNIFVVWTLTGLWHGAAWNFALWGLLYGIVLMAEKLWFGKVLEKLPSFISYMYVLLITFIGFVIFDATNIPSAFGTIKNMFGIGNIAVSGAESLYYLKSYAVTLFAAIIGATPSMKHLTIKLKQHKNLSIILDIAEPVFIALILIASTAYIIDGSFNPFLYFRF